MTRAAPHPDDLLACAVAAARAAGDYALRHAARRGEDVATFAHDIKLKLDGECQGVAESVIRKRFPGHAVLGEEDASPRDQGPWNYQWVIDPIDGTVNYAHGLSQWCCSVAVRSRTGVLAGAVFAPILDELYTAAENEPALLNGKPIRVSAVASAAAAMVMTGLDGKDSPSPRPFAIFERIASNVQKARVMGCAALDLCQVACGRADAYFESGIYVWDIAAAGFITEKAGGRTEVLGAFDGNRLKFLATNGRIHAEMRRIIGPFPS